MRRCYGNARSSHDRDPEFVPLKPPKPPKPQSSHDRDPWPHATQWCLLEIWEAYKFQIPTVLLTVVGCGERQLEPADAYALLSDLEASLEQRNPGALQELSRHLPKDVTIKAFSQILIDWLRWRGWGRGKEGGGAGRGDGRGAHLRCV